MHQREILISGDTPGVSWSVPVIEFKGSKASAPKTYMQGALHADELPGPATLHFLCKLLRQAETDNQLAGDITIVPQANPIGLAQMPNMQLQGRFDTISGTNFNRDFQRIALQDREKLLEDLEQQTPTNKLKNNLLYMALGADIMIDLHCDDESLLYTYVCDEFWPDSKDFAAAMNLHSVFVADGESSAFDEAVSYAFRHDNNPNPPRRFATTLELRGQRDVSEKLAKQDATGLFDFLIGRGVIKAKSRKVPDWNGKAVPLDNIEVVRTPVGGIIWLERSLGDIVKKGDLLAKIIGEPGTETNLHHVLAPQDGIVVTATSSRFAPRGGQLYKIICDKPTATQRKAGTLEA
jgi:predicted deacylase